MTYDGDKTANILLSYNKVINTLNAVLEHLNPLTKACNTLFTKLGKTCYCLLYRLLFIKMRLGKELISITDNLLFHGFREEVLLRKW